MKRAQKIAKECSRITIAVTYDLVIAKSSMQLQAEDSPTYDSLFINMEGSHMDIFFDLRKIYREIREARLIRGWCNTKIFINIFHYG